MLTEEQFQEEIYKRTGKTLGEYGLIAGTSYPTELRGMQSASMIQGFEVWKRTEKGNEIKTLNPKTQEESLEQIIEFLNGPVV